MMQLRLSHLDHIDSIAKTFVETIGDKKVLAFYGQMGAGKTTFIKAICKQLGVKDEVNSPTFAIINVYQTEKHNSIYHFDFYRIKSIEEAFDFGYEDYFYSGELCLIEWPELIEPILPDDTLAININQETDGSRTISFNS